MAHAACITGSASLTIADLNTTVSAEPRVMDLRLAEVLGFERARDIRKLIKRYEAILKGFAEVCAIWRKPTALGGRPGQTYYLNEEQALFITAKSDTERAALVTVEMVRVFRDFLRGRVEAQKVEVKAHHRAASRRATHSPTRDGCGCMSVAGEGTVWFDRRYLPRPGDIVLAINHCGQPVVATVADRPEADFTPSRVWVERWPRPMRTWEHMVWVGIVTTPAGRLMRGADQMMGGRA